MALIYPLGLASTDFSDGETGAAWQPQNFIYGGHFSIGAAGTVTQMGVKCRSNSGTVGLKFGLYNSSGTRLVQATGSVSNTGSLQWNDSGTFSQSVSAGTYYVLISAETDQAAYGYDTSGNGSFATEGYSTAMASSETITDQGDTGQLYGVRMDYTAGVTVTGDPTTLSLTGAEATFQTLGPVGTAFQTNAFQNNAFQIFVSAGGNVTTTGDPGSLTLTGGTAVLTNTLVGSAAGLTLTGLSANTTNTLLGAAGTLTFTGQSADFDTVFPATGASLTLTGVSADYTVTLLGSPGAVSLAGGSANFAVSFPGSAGALTLTGESAAFSTASQNIVTGDPGALDLTGTTAIFVTSFPGSGTTLTFSGTSADYTVTLPGSAGSLALGAADATFTVSYTGAEGALTLEGASAAFVVTAAGTLVADPGALTLEGADAAFVVVAPPGTQQTVSGGGGGYPVRRRREYEMPPLEWVEDYLRKIDEAEQERLAAWTADRKSLRDYIAKYVLPEQPAEVVETPYTPVADSPKAEAAMRTYVPRVRVPSTPDVMPRLRRIESLLRDMERRVAQKREQEQVAAKRKRRRRAVIAALLAS